jgi:hypothetical protein
LSASPHPGLTRAPRQRAPYSAVLSCASRSCDGPVPGAAWVGVRR